MVCTCFYQELIEVEVRESNELTMMCLIQQLIWFLMLSLILLASCDMVVTVDCTLSIDNHNNVKSEEIVVVQEAMPVHKAIPLRNCHKLGATASQSGRLRDGAGFPPLARMGGRGRPETGLSRHRRTRTTINICSPIHSNLDFVSSGVEDIYGCRLPPFFVPIVFLVVFEEVFGIRRHS